MKPPEEAVFQTAISQSFSLDLETPVNLTMSLPRYLSVGRKTYAAAAGIIVKKNLSSLSSAANSTNTTIMAIVISAYITQAILRLDRYLPF